MDSLIHLPDVRERLGISSPKQLLARFNILVVRFSRRTQALRKSDYDATLVQIHNASRRPSGGISETSVNAVLAFIEAAEPRNEIEAALAIQMACTHAVTLAVLNRAGGAYGGDRNVALMVSASARLLNAFVSQVETMRRLRNGGTQVIRVERIEVSDSAQAIIGNINSQRHEV
jgi:hypothetical protein